MKKGIVATKLLKTIKLNISTLGQKGCRKILSKSQISQTQETVNAAYAKTIINNISV